MLWGPRSELWGGAIALWGPRSELEGPTAELEGGAIELWGSRIKLQATNSCRCQPLQLLPKGSVRIEPLAAIQLKVMTMNLPPKSENLTTQLTYPALLEAVAGGWIAAIPGWSECRVIGSTRQEATERLQQVLAKYLQAREPLAGELIKIELQFPSVREHPAAKFEEFFINDPLFNEMLAVIEANRQADKEAYLRELDAEEARNKGSAA